MLDRMLHCAAHDREDPIEAWHAQEGWVADLRAAEVGVSAWGLLAELAALAGAALAWTGWLAGRLPWLLF